MTTYGAALVSRNDDYGENQIERTLYSVNSILRSFDECIYVDWASEKQSLVEEIKSDLINKSKFKYVIVTPKQAKEWTSCFENPQICTEVLGRNIGLRRLTTDFMVSTNPDVIQPPREELEKFTATDLFAPAGKRTISLYDVRPLGGIKDDIAKILMDHLTEFGGQQPVVEVYPGEYWSMVSGPGDFQIAYKDIWYKIRGFEESLMGRGFADSNVQKKALLALYRIEVDWSIPVWHIGHGAGGGGYGGWNDIGKALADFVGTTNKDTWGFSDDASLELRTL